MKGTIVTGSLIVFSDGFVWKRLSNEKAYKIWVSAENEDFELYKVRVDDESESLIESLEDLQDAFKQDHHVCIEVGKLPYSIDLNYLRNLQEMSVTAVDDLMGLKECGREEAHKAEMLKNRAEICERYDKRIKQAEAEKKIMLCVFDYGLSTDNAIYYPHLNTLSFNWNSYGKKITQEEFDDFVNKVDRSQLPEDIRFELK